MGNFSHDVQNKAVVDARGEELGRITSIEGGYARLKPETGVASRMEKAVSPDEIDGFGITADQIVEVTEDYVRIDMDAAEE